MGTLFIPSLKEKKFFEIRNVSLEDATSFVEDLTAKIKAGHKIKDSGDNAKDFVIFNGMFNDLSEDEIEVVAEALKIADARGTRGARAVFVEDDGTFAVGSTVIYNRNWATIGFDDTTVLDKLRRAGFDLTIDQVKTPSANLPDNSASWFSAADDTDARRWQGSSYNC